MMRTLWEGGDFETVQEVDVRIPQGLAFSDWDVADARIVVGESSVNPFLSGVTDKCEHTLGFIDMDNVQVSELDVDVSGVSTVNPIRADVWIVFLGHDGIVQGLNFDLLHTVDIFMMTRSQGGKGEDGDEFHHLDGDGGR